MKFLRTVFGTLLLSVTFASGEEAEYVRGEDPQKDAILDMQMGMQGLKAASKDPKILAQLMADLQDPEMMAAAKKMMEGKEYQEQMKNIANSAEFKSASAKTKEMMEDPASAARVQAQMEHMVKRGQEGLTQDAKDSMTDAMNAMNDPDVMATALKMLKDPKFMAQLQASAKDPAFQPYFQAMQEMVKDPEMKAQMDKIGDTMKAELS